MKNDNFSLKIKILKIQLIIYQNLTIFTCNHKRSKSLKQKIFEETKNNILRYYGICSKIIKDFVIKNMILVSRSKKKIIGIDGFGIKIIKQEIIK